LTSRKFVLALDQDTLTSALETLEAAGVRLPLDDAPDAAGWVATHAPLLFDPDWRPMVTCKNPPPGEDILTASANNLYEGVRLADLEGFVERYPLNSRLVRGPDGSLVEEVYRIGGRYGETIRR